MDSSSRQASGGSPAVDERRALGRQADGDAGPGELAAVRPITRGRPWTERARCRRRTSSISMSAMIRCQRVDDRQPDIVSHSLVARAGESPTQTLAAPCRGPAVAAGDQSEDLRGAGRVCGREWAPSGSAPSAARRWGSVVRGRLVLPVQERDRCPGGGAQQVGARALLADGGDLLAARRRDLVPAPGARVIVRVGDLGGQRSPRRTSSPSAGSRRRRGRGPWRACALPPPRNLSPRARGRRRGRRAAAR